MRIQQAVCLLLFFSLAVLPGCWSRKELNELAVVMAMGIDAAPEGYAVSAQVLNSGEARSTKGAAGKSLPVLTYKAVGQTVPDALQHMLSTAPRTLYLSHIRVLVLGEKLARQGVSDILDFITRNHQLRSDFFLVVAKNSQASDILEINTPFEQIPASSLYSSILVSHKNWAATGKVTLQQFILELERGGSNPIMSGVRLNGDVSEGGTIKNIESIVPKTQIVQAGIAVFKKDRLVGWLNESSSKTLNYTLNEVDSSNGIVSCPDGGKVGFIITRSESRILPRLNSAGEPEFTLSIHAESDLTTVNGTLDLTKPANIALIETRIENKFINNMEGNIQSVQQDYSSDIFGFGEALHRKYPRVWKKYRDGWDDHFKHVKVRIACKLQIRRIGSIVQPQRREMELK
ncbi:Ger(x)C family spore germination protein [Paenibacillus sp. FSL R7-0337]|uniref:Ger(x)C family spore germination protein n=1 Tax=Paenibacillus sp. FSL R7-0337 TaxID=1926588 RepID=UPI00096CBC94|nr:Ger(x)C family spore germination protein [Paenibacillus sp. FSL R7-0337]OMF90367.1 spore gernimation protein GerC [Paenibacillus sp. FSL R7-0337]